jgi:hypothetical protein
MPSPRDAMPLSFMGPSKSTLRFEDLHLWSHALEENTGFKEPLREFWDPGYRAGSATPAAFSLITNKERAEQDKNNTPSQLAQMGHLIVPHKATPGVTSCEDPLSSFAAASSFDVTTQHLSVLASLSSPQVVPPHAYDAYAFKHLDHLTNPLQVNQLDEKEGSYLTTALASTRISGWAQNAYNMSDRTTFGSLAALAPGLRKRSASHPRAEFSTGMSCKVCDRVFASKSDRE